MKTEVSQDVVSNVVNSVPLVWERIGHLYINTRFLKTELSQYVVSYVVNSVLLV